MLECGIFSEKPAWMFSREHGMKPVAAIGPQGGVGTVGLVHGDGSADASLRFGGAWVQGAVVSKPAGQVPAGLVGLGTMNVNSE